MKTHLISPQLKGEPQAPIQNARTRIGIVRIAILTSSFLILQLSPAQVPSWPDPVANHVVPYQSLGITHGPILGGVTESSVKIWIRSQEAMPFDILISEQLPFDSAIRYSGETQSKHDFTGWIEINQLQPNTRYYYAVQLRGEIVDIRASVNQPWPSFQTLP